MLIAEFKSVGDWEYCLMLVDAAAWKRKRVNDVLVEIDWEKGRKWTVHNGGGGHLRCCSSWSWCTNSVYVWLYHLDGMKSKGNICKHILRNSPCFHGAWKAGVPARITWKHRYCVAMMHDCHYWTRGPHLIEQSDCGLKLIKIW
jgi:hypothetical protein